MLLTALVTLFIVFHISTAIKCESDVDLDQVTSYDQTFEHPPGDKKYWKTRQISYQVYGVNEGDPVSSKTTIRAGLYTKKNQLITGLEVNCMTEEWILSTTDPRERSSDIVTDYRRGMLENPCNETFDIWLKVDQPFMLSWIFNGQALDFSVREHNKRKGVETYLRFRKNPVEAKYGTTLTDRLSIEADGAASFVRVAYGQCYTWPRYYQDPTNPRCDLASKWVEKRNKGVNGQGYFGANNFYYRPECYEESEYYNNRQLWVHPDHWGKLSYPYCCCTDMRTGKVKDGDVEGHCYGYKNTGGLIVSGMVGSLACPVGCLATFDHEVSKEVIYRDKTKDSS